LITCPTCGGPVSENQRFCGNCGTDVQAAMAYRASAQNPPSATPTPADPGGVYGYDPGAYDYTPAARQRPAAAMIWLIVAGVAVVCLCCGLVIGGVASYVFFPTQSAPPPTPAPTPEGLNLLMNLLKV
jgi:zinc ribbon protein